MFFSPSRAVLRTFARKSSHIEICFISRLKLCHKLLIPKMKKKKNGGVTNFVSEKKVREKCPNFERWVIITRCSLIYSSVENVRVKVSVHGNIGVGFLDNFMPLGMS